MSLMRDPKGYYIALAIEEDADTVTIKAAFRAKAKRLHPDFNPSPIAAKQFNRLHEAYATLIDPKKRAAYDKPWKFAPKPKQEATPKPEPRAEPKAEPRAEPRPEPRAEARPQPAPEPPARRVHPDTPVTCQCGQITAQPRYVIFDMVWGRLKRVQRHTVTGVFCRTCADKAAIRASLVTWLAGWWAWPEGPRETIRALLNNTRGGRKPADRNARLLMRQARAFKARGDLELAYHAAVQARTFARAANVRRDVESVIAGLGPPPTRVLVDRWAQQGLAPTVQMLPLAFIGAVVAVVATLSLHTPQPDSFRAPAIVKMAPAPKPVLKVFSISVDKASLRTGPNDAFDVIATLAKGEHVAALDADTGGAWLRVARADGTVGFVATAVLTPAP